MRNKTQCRHTHLGLHNLSLWCIFYRSSVVILTYLTSANGALVLSRSSAGDLDLSQTELRFSSAAGASHSSRFCSQEELYLRRGQLFSFRSWRQTERMRDK